METSTEEREYDAFLEKVKRTFYVDNLSPQVTESVLRAAFDQFGSVNSIQFIPNYLEPNIAPQAALVEMETPKQAKEIKTETDNYPFMVLGMPRPARVRAATVEMFEDRPRKPGRRIVCRWLEPRDPKFEVAKKIKNAVRTHAAEASHLLEKQREEEEKLGNKQSETLKAQYKKFEMLDFVFDDGTAKKLAHRYGVPLSDV